MESKRRMVGIAVGAARSAHFIAPSWRAVPDQGRNSLNPYINIMYMIEEQYGTE